MSYSVKQNAIYLTRGDTFMADVRIFQTNGDPYQLQEGDTIRFAMKKTLTDEEPLVIKDVPIDTRRLVLDPEDTKLLPFGTYIYDVQLTKVDGTVDTFITPSKLVLTEEVD